MVWTVAGNKKNQKKIKRGYMVRIKYSDKKDQVENDKRQGKSGVNRKAMRKVR